MKPQLSQRVGWLWKSSLAMLALLLVGLIVWLTPLGDYLSLASFSVRYDLTTDARYQTYSLHNARAQAGNFTIDAHFIANAKQYVTKYESGYISGNDCTHEISSFLTTQYGMPSSMDASYTDTLVKRLLSDGDAQVITGDRRYDSNGFVSVAQATPIVAGLDTSLLEHGGSYEYLFAYHWSIPSYNQGALAGHLATYVSNKQVVSHGISGDGQKEWNITPRTWNVFNYIQSVAIIALTNGSISPTGGASPVFTSGHRPVVARDANGRMEVFEVAQDTQLWHEWQTNTQGSWSGWHSMGGSWPQDPAVALDTNGYLHIFIVGNTGSNGQATLFHAQQTSPGSDTWTGWNPLAGAWPSGVPTVARNLAGGLEVFMRGLDANLYHSWQCSGCSGGWSGWYPMGGNWNTNPVAADNHNGTMSVFMVGESSELYVNQENTGGGWSGWLSLHGSWPGQPAVATNLGNGLEVFMRGQNHTLYHAWQTSPGSASWSGWNSLGGVLPRDPVVANNADGRIEVFTIGTDATLYNQWEDSVGHWSGWHSLGGNWPGQPAVALNLVNGLEVFIAGNSTTMYHAWQNGAGNSSSYTTWNHMPT